jgi:hypothetical protein
MSGRGLILVCDDDASRVEMWANDIRQVDSVAETFDVRALQPHQFADAFRALVGRKASARTGQLERAEGPVPDALSAVDSADLLVVDYDLTPVADRTPDPVEDKRALDELIGKTGEEFAYLARCFSTAAGIVVVNQRVQRRVFDLTLQQFADSFANLNVTSRYLATPALWTGSGGEFRPWSWPRLIDVPAHVRRTWELIDDLDQCVLEALGLDDDEHLYAFTQPQLDLLGDDPRAATFEFLACESEFGLNAKDRQGAVGDDAKRRIAAAAVTRWLEGRVLPGQNVLIDAPHLAQRYPALLKAETSDLAAWNRTADLSAPDPGLDLDTLAGARVPASAWVSRPVWSLPRVVRHRSALLRTSNGDSRVFVFCEDTSQFVDIDRATEIEIAVPTPYFQRFVEIVDGVDYTPRRRIRQ